MCAIIYQKNVGIGLFWVMQGENDGIIAERNEAFFERRWGTRQGKPNADLMHSPFIALPERV